MGNRVCSVFNKLKEKTDVILIKNSVYPHIDNNFFYSTGLDYGIFEESIAILYPDGNVDLIVSELEAESAEKANIDINVYSNKKGRDLILAKLLTSVDTIGVNFNEILHKDFRKLQIQFPEKVFFDVSEAFNKARLMKDKFELDLIRKSCKIADVVMENIPGLLHDGIREYEAAAEIDYLMQKNGADKPAFTTISSFGSNSAEPHYTHGDRALKKCDFALFDFGASYRRYNSDITRTFVFGKADSQQKEMYETVREAQKIGLDAIKPGVEAREIHNLVASYINKSKFKGRFIHSTGHSLGLAVHDSNARLSSENNTILEENMVFTVEPGVYIAGKGGVRIEDDIVIKKTGAELLTKTSKELLEI